MKALPVLLVGFLIVVSTAMQDALAKDGKTYAAQKRQYAGGEDEEDIRVQIKLRAPVRLVNLRSIQKNTLDAILKEAEVSEKVDTPQ